ncbi:acyl carrier protein [Catenuloplanes indicus]|uniref:Acyl carrier protein n=1 Tax=Catenuloplanes indicus TaxID=137267 RepID=A0AAE3VX47_9ACTN|nr:phosphopantetheine-binding protein [Catenuloplanes indicus]MDQ0364912.1 acyl carrier protein [Catenuloplanes indicus]
MDPRFTELLTGYLPYLDGRPLTPDSRLRDLGLDSMHSIDLLFAIEDALQVTLPDDYLNDETFATAGSLWEAVRVSRDAVAPGRS